jgi:hypothetical protein
VWLAALRQMALADGDFSPEEEAWLANHLQSLLPSAGLNWHELSSPSLDALHQALGDDHTQIHQFLSTAVLVALADGHLSVEELELLRHWSEGLHCNDTPIAALTPSAQLAEDQARHWHVLAPLKHWLDQWDPVDPHVAAFVVSLISAQCPFERNIVLFGRKLVHIPPMCKINPLYDQWVGLRFRCLGHWPEDQQQLVCHQETSQP